MPVRLLTSGGAALIVSNSGFSVRRGRMPGHNRVSLIMPVTWGSADASPVLLKGELLPFAHPVSVRNTPRCSGIPFPD